MRRNDRVGTDWQNGECLGQIEADEKLENAKATADRYGCVTIQNPSYEA